MKIEFRKKILAFLVLSVLAATPLFSQQFALGVIGGPSRTYFYGRDFGQVHPALNYVAGVTAEYSFTEVFAILAIPCFEGKGNAFELSLTDEKGNSIGETKVKNTLNYFTLPILARAKLGNDKVKFLANAGPYFSYLISAKNNLGLAGPARSVRDMFQDIDLGATVGIGVEFSLTSNLLFSLLVSSDIGLYDVSTSNVSNAVKNNSTALLVGLAYAFGKENAQK